MKMINREKQEMNASVKAHPPTHGTKSCQLISAAYQIFGIGMLSAHAQDPLADSLQDSSSRDASLGQSPPILLAQNIPMPTGIECVKWHGARPSPSYNFSQPRVYNVEPSEPPPPSANELIGRDWSQKGGEFEKKGDYANAYKCYNEAVRYGYMVQYLGPLRDHAHAMALYKQGDLENALTVAIKLVQTAIRENQVNRAYEVDYATIGYALGNRGADQCYAKGDYAAQAEAYKWAVWFAKKGVQSSDNAGKAAWQMNVILAEAKLAGAKARMYEKAGNLKKAIDWQQRSLLHAREIQASGREPNVIILKRSQDLERLKGQLAQSQSSGGTTHRGFFGIGSVPPEKAGLTGQSASDTRQVGNNTSALAQLPSAVHHAEKATRSKDPESARNQAEKVFDKTGEYSGSLTPPNRDPEVPNKYRKDPVILRATEKRETARKAIRESEAKLEKLDRFKKSDQVEFVNESNKIFNAQNEIHYENLVIGEKVDALTNSAKIKPVQ